MAELSQGHFFQKYVLPAVAIFFTWGALGHFYMTTLQVDSLVKKKGKVNSISIRFEQGTKHKYKYYPLKIELENHPEDFRIPDVYKIDFDYLQDNILAGDTITLFTRHMWQAIIGMGKQADIYQIEKNNKTLFFISTVREEQRTQATIFAVFSIIFCTWYIIYRRTAFAK